MWNMTTPASSLTVSTSAMMVVISVSRWAGGEGDQQQLKQLPLRMDASRDTTPYQKGYMADAA